MDQYRETQNNGGIILLALPPNRVPAGAEERLRQAGDGRDVRITSGKAEIEPLLDSVEIGLGDVPFSLISRMPRLRWVQLWSAGADRMQKYPELKALPFQLTSASGMHGQQLTEHIFALLLAWNRRLAKALALQSRHEWRQIGPGELPVLSGKTMLILGYGSIGKTAARAAQAFGMRVIGVRRSIPAIDAAGPAEPDITLASSPELPEYLARADVVVNILPLTPDTRHCFGQAEFALMKRDALYINVGRGATTDEAALIEALRSGRIAGALLDVAEQEPLPPDSPLWDMENVILTGHYAGLRADYDLLALDIALDNLGRYIRGEPLRNLVDKERGY
jgi:phosphoglycerate dehydrogenase-like enzyme